MTSYIYKIITDENIEMLKTLASEAEEEGYRFVAKTIEEWRSGKNHFDNAGEILYGVFDGKSCIAIGGLNIDPYQSGIEVGRVRHIYVSKEHRRCGIAHVLLDLITEHAKENFDVLRLSTDNDAAAYAYEKYGFKKNSRR